MGSSAQARLIATAIVDNIPELNERVIIEQLDEKVCSSPFVYVGLPVQKPVFAKNGIAGYDSIAEIRLVANDRNGAEQLKHRIIGALKVFCTGEHRWSLSSISSTEIKGDCQQVKLIYQLS